MDITKLRPKRRSRFRIFMGKYYFTVKRYFQWIFDKNKYAKEKQHELYPNVVNKHQTYYYDIYVVLTCGFSIIKR